MRRRLLAIVLVVLMIIGTLPIPSMAADTFTCTIQAVVVDENGRWVSTNELTSKNFSGQVASGSAYNGPWTWTPDNGGYTMVSDGHSTEVNAFGHLKHPSTLWEYDSSEYKFIGIGVNSYATEPEYDISETTLNSVYWFERQSFVFAPGTTWRTYIFQQKAPETPDPAITGFDKERLTESPAGGTLDLPEGVTVTYDENVVIPVDGSVTLLYQLTVKGEAGTEFTITDDGATLVGDDCEATQNEVDKTITGTIPDGGTATLYVIKTFTAADIDEGNVNNTASITTDAEGGVDEDVTDPSVDTPAEEGAPDAPDKGTLNNLLAEAVKVQCNNEAASHSEKEKLYGLIDGGYTLAESVSGNAENGYTYAITIHPEAYVTQYNTDTDLTHQLDPDTQGDQTITLTYNDGWKRPDSGVPVTFTVVCEDETDDLNGTDVTVQVFVDGQPVTNPSEYVTLTRDTTDTNHNDFALKSGPDNKTGVMTYDFDYSEGEDADDSAGFDCVNIEVNVTDNAYILQGVESFQSKGQSGTSNVRDNLEDEDDPRATFTVDNVTSDNNEGTVDCKIYLRSKYSVQYFLNDVRQMETPYNDTTVYISKADVTTTTATENYPTDQTATEMTWQNNANYALSIESLPALPTGGDQGWFLGSVENTETMYEPASEFTAIDQTSDSADGAEDHVIQFYATTDQAPTAPDKDQLNNLLDVELDCDSNVGHVNKIYEELLEDSYVLDKNVVQDPATGVYTIGVTVKSDKYIEDYDAQELNPKGTHEIKDGTPAEKRVTLTWEDNQWTVADADKLILFTIVCSGTGDYDINDFEKDLVAGDEDKAAAQVAGVAVDSYTIPEIGETVVIPYNGEVTLLYKITVTGNLTETADFIVTDAGADFVQAVGGVEIAVDEENDKFSGTIPASGSVSFYVSKTFTGDDINAKGNLVNSATVEGETVDPGKDDDEEEVPGTEDKADGTVTVRPADLTIYEGGNGGYDAVVDSDGNTVSEAASASLPHPLFEITGVENPENLTFTNGRNEWKVVSDGDNLYHFEATNPETMDPVRVTYTNGDEVITNDEFTPTTDSFVQYKIHLYAGSNEPDFSNVTAINGDSRYAIDGSGEGTLTVRAVDAADPDDVVSEIVETAPTTDVAEGTAVAVEPAQGTIYTLNDTDVVVDEADSQPSLLFDGIIDDDVNRTEMLQDKVDEALGGADADRNYDIKYLDLVDANNGNAWIASSNGTDIFWGYPEGTDENTDFQILHFKGLHRDSTDGSTSGFNPDDLEAIDVNNPDQMENVTITKTDEGIFFHVSEANFSPYALVWENGNSGGNDPWYPPYNPGDDDKPSGLNTEDHFSYVVGYEDGMVKPQRSITRAEVATIFYRLLEDDVRDDYDTTRNNFSDVTSDSWYNQTVSTLASMGILKGYEDGTFRPNASITRAEFAAIATRFFEETGATYEPGTFTDVTGDEWFAGAIMDAVNLGLIGGYEDGTVRPNNNITRAEACAIVNRTLGRVPDADHLLPADEMTTWPDNPSSAWFYADMQEATNGHEYEWITEDGNKIEEWTDILDKDWNDR